MGPRRILQQAVIAGAISLTVLGASLSAAGQAPARAATVPAILLSDPHFDPFHDPSKLPRLIDAPITQWRAILAEPDSPTQPAALNAIQKACNVRGLDSSYALFASALHAAHAQQPNARFVTLSGDLLVHNFDCRFRAALPGRAPTDSSDFAEKTLHFVLAELHRDFAVPVYVTLGNNDSACGDYHLDEDSSFLRSLAQQVVRDLARIKDHAVLAGFQHFGDYSVLLPAPIQHTRIIVLNDMFLSARYAGCDGKPAPAAAAGQLAWLRAQLGEAAQRHEAVWVMAHLPVGIDVYTTYTQHRNVCAGAKPELFLSSSALGDELTAHAGIVRLAIFAHTHMDEMRLLQPEDEAAPKDKVERTSGSVPVKLAASISPINGNHPAFTVARIAPATGTLVDYMVYNSPDYRGHTWTEEYTFSETYHQPEFSAATLGPLTAQFRADPGAQTTLSKDYLRFYFDGSPGVGLDAVWPAYLCAVNHYTAAAFDDCICKEALPAILSHQH